MRLADLVVETGAGPEATEHAKGYVMDFLREADISDKLDAWKRLAQLCKLSGDALGEVSAVCQAALLPTVELSDLSDLANRLNNRLRELKDLQVEAAWSAEMRELLTRMASVMETRLTRLDATGCSRLAWLYLNIGKSDRALDIAKIGVEKEPGNRHCRQLIERLEQ